MAQRFRPSPTTLGGLPALGSANQGAVRPPGPPYTQPARITSPRTPDAWSTTCSCAGRHATSLTGFSGVVSSTMRSPVSPWTHTPLVKITVLGLAPRRPASISVSIAVLSLVTPFGEHSNAAWTRDRKSTRLNSSHVRISYAVFCLIKKDPGRVENAESLSQRCVL